MNRLLGLGLSVIGLLLASAPASAQMPSLTVTPKTNANPAVPPPAGTKRVYAEGTYTLAPGQTVSKVVVKWYKPNGMNLVYVGEVDDQAPAGGNYKTGEMTVDINDAQGNPISYTGIATLYVTGNPNPVASAAFTNYRP